MKYLKSERKLILISALVVLILAGAHFCRYILPYDPFKTSMGESALPPSSQHWFGTDNLGRDVFSRVLQGSQTSLYTALGVVPVSYTHLRAPRD